MQYATQKQIRPGDPDNPLVRIVRVPETTDEVKPEHNIEWFATCPNQETADKIVRTVNAHDELCAALAECLLNTGGGWISAAVIERGQAALKLANGGEG